MARRLAAAYNWLDERAAVRSLLRKGLYEAVPVRGAWFYTLGSATLVLILLQLITGIFLTLLYVPSVTEAWASLEYLKQHDAFGSIVRGIHLWSAYVLLFVIGLVTYPTLLGALLPPAVFMAITVIEGQFLTPAIVGRRVLNLHPLVIFLGIAFWAWLWGPIGAFLATPILIVARVALTHLYPHQNSELPG